MISRLLLGLQPPRQGRSGAAESDPNRRSTAINYCIAKGSFDHFVGAAEQRERHGEAKPLGGSDARGYCFVSQILSARRVGRVTRIGRRRHGCGPPLASQIWEGLLV